MRVYMLEPNGIRGENAFAYVIPWNASGQSDKSTGQEATHLDNVDVISSSSAQLFISSRLSSQHYSLY